MASFKDIKDLVQEAIDKGATSVEEVHQAIASKPFELAEQMAPNILSAKSVEQLQRKTIGSVYDTIRQVNKTVGEIAETLLSKIEQK